MFTLKETICPKICSKLRLKSAKGPFPDDLRRSKTSLLKVLLKTIQKMELIHLLFPAHRSHRNCARVSHAMGQFFFMEQPHHWKRSEGIQLRSPTPIIANVTAIGNVHQAMNVRSRLLLMFIFLAPVVQKMDRVIHRINHYRVDKY